MEFAIILGLVVVVCIQVAVANTMQNLAEMKGHTNRVAWHLSFWLGMLGWVYTAALPDLRLRTMLKKLTVPTGSAQPSEKLTVSTGLAQPSEKKIEGHVIATGKCEVCDKENVELFDCVIKDKYGTRYRKACSTCLSLNPSIHLVKSDKDD